MSLKNENLKYMFIDLDGTVLCSKKLISKELFGTLNVLMNNQMNISITTGRSPGDSLSYYRMLKLESYMINFNGNLIWNPVTREILYAQYIKKIDVLLKFIFDMYGKIDIQNIAISSDLVNIFYNNKDKPLIDLLSDDELQNIFLDKESIMNFQHAQRLILSINPMNLIKWTEIIKDKFPDIDVAWWSDRDDIIDINIRQSSKWDAICKVIKKINGDLNETICFGDSKTDLDMVINSRVGVAMKNADEILLSHADYVTEYDNDNNGVNHFILINLF